MNIVRKYLIPNQNNDYKPHLLRKTGVACISLLALALFAVGIFQNLLFLKTGILSAVLPPVLVDLANQDRTSNQLAVLTVNPILEKAAQAKANDMAAKSYFAHTSPEGKTPWYWFSDAGYKYSSAGENLAINFTDSGEVNTAWMNSPGHRANILNGKFTEIGIATAQGTYNGQATVFVVQMFGKPAQTKKPSVVITPKPKAPATTTIATNVLGATTTASTSPSNSKKNTIGVLGETAPETVLAESVVSGTEMFVAIESTDPPEVVSDSTPKPVQNAGMKEKFLTSQKRILVIGFEILAGLVILAIALLIGIEIKRQHPRNVIAGIILLLFIIVLLYLSQTMFGSVVVI